VTIENHKKRGIVGGTLGGRAPESRFGGTGRFWDPPQPSGDEFKGPHYRQHSYSLATPVTVLRFRNNPHDYTQKEPSKIFVRTEFFHS
jgi:hypothetical protein